MTVLSPVPSVGSGKSEPFPTPDFSGPASAQLQVGGSDLRRPQAPALCARSPRLAAPQRFCEDAKAAPSPSSALGRAAGEGAPGVGTQASGPVRHPEHYAASPERRTVALTSLPTPGFWRPHSKQ